MRTDENNNPTAMTTEVAEQGGLEFGIDYEVGTPFRVVDKTFFTARLLGDPIPPTIRVIDKIGYYTLTGYARWTYIAIPMFVWNALSFEQKRDVIGFHYHKEGGIAMRSMFPNWGEK